MSEYSFSVENISESYGEMRPLYEQHYAEMRNNFMSNGVELGPFKPNEDMFHDAVRAGNFIGYVARFNGEPVGYFNFYLTNDSLDGELVAHEDALYAVKDHRNGLGKQLLKFAVEQLKRHDVKRLYVTGSTDPRVSNLWSRMGFKPVAQVMVLSIKELS
jgi:GNAT superfamily N-acetyltransferase